MTALWSLDAERGVLGALLDDNSLIERMDRLNVDSFHEPVHRKLFEDITTMIRAGRVADPVSLKHRYGNNLDEIGGAAYLLNLYKDRPRLGVHVDEYSALVVDMAVRRSLKAIADRVLIGLESGAWADDVLDEADDALKRLDRSAGSLSAAALTIAMGLASDALDTDQARGLQSGWRDLDQRLGGFFPGNLILVAGRPGMGKSSLASNLSRKWAYSGLKGHFASYEMSVVELGERALGAATGIAYTSFRRAPQTVNRDFVAKALAAAPSTLLIDATPAQTVAQLEASARHTRRRLGGLDFVIVDYLQLMKTPGHHPSLVSKITEISQDLKALAKRLDVPVIALSQMSRGSESRHGQDRRPQLSDLRDSGSLEQDADVVLGLFREEYYLAREEPDDVDQRAAWKAKMKACANLLEVITLKQRQGPTGVDVLTAYMDTDSIMDRVPVDWRRGQ